MSAFSTLLALINAQIKTNGLKAITGAKLNGVLVQMVNELGSGYQFIDIATPATDPGTPDENVWYIASQAGTYTNFGGIIVNENEVCALVWNGSWTKKVTGAATAAQVSQLGQDLQSLMSYDKDEQTLTDFFDDQAIAWSSGDRTSYDGAAICKAITLNKNEGIIFIGAAAVQWAAIARNSQAQGYANPATPLVQGLGYNVVKTYIYTASEDNTYIQLSYIKASEHKAYKVSSNVLKQINLDITSSVTSIDDTALDFPPFQANHEYLLGNIITSSSKFYRCSTPHISEDSIDLTNFTEISDFHIGGPAKQKVVIGNNGGDVPIYLQNIELFYIGSSPQSVASAMKVDDVFYTTVTHAMRIKTAEPNTFKTLPPYKGVIYTYQGELYIWDGADLSKVIDKDMSMRIDDISTRIDDTEKVSNGGYVGGYNVLTNTVTFSANATLRNRINVKLNAGTIIRIKIDCDVNIRYPSLFWSNGSAIDTEGIEEKFGSWYTFNAPSETDAIVAYLDQSLVSQGGTISMSIVAVSPVLLRDKLAQFMNTDTLSDVSDTFASALSFDFSDEGILYGTALTSEDAYNELNIPNRKSKMYMANLADVNKTKESVTLVEQGQSHFASIMGAIDTSYPFGCKVVENDKVNAAIGIGHVIDGTHREHGLFTRSYIPSTRQLSTDVQQNTLYIPFDGPDGTTYDLKTEYELDEQTQTWEETDAQKAIIEHIWEVTGIEHFQRGGKYQYGFGCGSNPQKCPYAENGVNYFYVPMVLGGSSHALCKSADLINWIFVCDIPFVQNSIEEACVCFADNKIFALSRGQHGTGEDGKDSRIISCELSKLEDRDSSDWSSPVVFKNCFNERPTTAAINDIIYIILGNGQNASADGITVPRGKKSVITLDTNLNILTWDRFDFTYPILHFHLMSWSGQLWFYSSTDKRCFFANKNGDCRNEVSFGRLDDKLLAL